MPPGPYPSSRLPIVLLLDEGSGSGWLQPLAGEIVWCDRPLTCDATSAGSCPRPEPAQDQEWTPIYDGPGLLAGGLERIRSARGDLGAYRVTHADGETFLVAADGGLIRRATSRTGKPDIARALGAPLALALALRGTYLLHASALRRSDGAVLALSADSGAGKSTLAAAAGRHPELALTRVADDQLPVRLGRLPAALPHFPQLKLAAADQYPRGQPNLVPLLCTGRNRNRLEHRRTRARSPSTSRRPPEPGPGHGRGKALRSRAPRAAFRRLCRRGARAPGLPLPLSLRTRPPRRCAFGPQRAARLGLETAKSRPPSWESGSLAGVRVKVAYGTSGRLIAGSPSSVMP